MSKSATEIIRDVFEKAHAAWVFELASEPQRLLDLIESEIRDTRDEIARRLGSSDIDLLQEMQSDPSGLAPLIQLFTSATSVEMRAMVYCALRGMEIKSIAFKYQAHAEISLEIVLTQVATGLDHSFQSSATWDAEILRHLGIMTLDGRPVLHGFYAFA